MLPEPGVDKKARKTVVASKVKRRKLAPAAETVKEVVEEDVTERRDQPVELARKPLRYWCVCYSLCSQKYFIVLSCAVAEF